MEKSCFLSIVVILVTLDFEIVKPKLGNRKMN